MSAAPAEAHQEWTEWRGELARHFEFLDKDGSPVEFDGWLEDESSTYTPETMRWTEIQVYLTITGAYVVRVLGRSMIYHRNNSSCNTGASQHGRDMDEDLRPCPKCRPVDYDTPAQDDAQFNVEVDIPTITRTPSARGMIRALHWKGGNSISYLAANLLDKIRQVDPAVDAELRKPRSLN